MKFHVQHQSGSLRSDSTLRLIPASFTPMHSNGAVDYDSVAAYASYLAQSGIRDVFVNGTTGEGLSLTTEERMHLVEAWDRQRGDLSLIVHVGDNCITNAITMAKHAEQAGVAGFSTMAPTFFRPQDNRELLDFLEPIAAAAPTTPFYFYHLPSMTGVSLDMVEFIGRAIDRFPNFAGVKYTHEDLEEFVRCQEAWGKRTKLFFGRDELLLPALACGAQAAVGSFFNIIPQVFQRIGQLYQRRDNHAAVDWQHFANQYIAICKEVGVIAAGKAILATEGIGCGAVRLPLQTLGGPQREEILLRLRQLPSPASKHSLPDTHHAVQVYGLTSTQPLAE